MPRGCGSLCGEVPDGCGGTLTCGECTTGRASSVEQHGITWTFDAEHEVGQFANGDWWVVGPVTLVEISPASVDDTNGTMINPEGTSEPWPTQGWDARMEGCNYDPDLNSARTMPLRVENGSSVVSSISLPEIVSHMALDTIAILTVLEGPPAPGSFRPSYLGDDKTIRWNARDIDYSRLRRIPRTEGLPSLESVEERYDHAYIVLASEYFANFASPYNNLPVPGRNYGREHAQGATEAALLLNSDYTDAEKERLAIGFIQWGLDVFGAAQAGVWWGANGGHQHGRKLPMLMAGVLLGDADITAMASSDELRFQEDCQHFFVSQEDIDTPRHVDPLPGRPIDPFEQSHLGRPEWGPNHCTQPTHSGSNWGLIYRDVVCPNLLGHALAGHLMGIEELWGDDAFFAYYDERYWGEHDGDSAPEWVREMWTAAGP